MAPKYIVVIVFIWVTGSFMGFLFDTGTSLDNTQELTQSAYESRLEADSDNPYLCIRDNDGDGDTEYSESWMCVIDTLTVYRILNDNDQPWGLVKFPIAIAKFFNSILVIVTFNYSFLEDNPYAEHLRLILSLVFGALVVYGIIMTVIGVFSRVLS